MCSRVLRGGAGTAGARDLPGSKCIGPQPGEPDPVRRKVWALEDRGSPIWIEA